MTQIFLKLKVFFPRPINVKITNLIIIFSFHLFKRIAKIECAKKVCAKKGKVKSTKICVCLFNVLAVVAIVTLFSSNGFVFLHAQQYLTKKIMNTFRYYLYKSILDRFGSVACCLVYCVVSINSFECVWVCLTVSMRLISFTTIMCFKIKFTVEIQQDWQVHDSRVCTSLALS